MGASIRQMPWKHRYGCCWDHPNRVWGSRESDLGASLKESRTEKEKMQTGRDILGEDGRQ